LFPSCPILYPQYLWMAFGPLVPVLEEASALLVFVMGIVGAVSAVAILLGRFRGGRKRS